MRERKLFMLIALSCGCAVVVLALQDALTARENRPRARQGMAESEQHQPESELEQSTRRFFTARSRLERRRAAREVLRLARSENLKADTEVIQFVAESASEALYTDVPYPLAFDGNGNAVPGQLDAEFVTWANSNGMTPGDAAVIALYDQPIEIAQLIGLDDPVAITTLTDALDAANHLVVIIAAEGLVAVGYTESIPAIEEVAIASPTEVALVLADLLESFGTAEGTNAAAEVRAAK